MKLLALLTLALAETALFGGPMPPVQTVFVIIFENKTWTSVASNSTAPYINSLLPSASYCQQYYTPPKNHPSEPNYIWLEAGTNFGIADDNPPAINAQNTTNHFTTLLNNAGISWKTYQEGISGTQLGLVANPTNAYDPRHNPFLYFYDVTGTNNPTYPYGLAHERPFSELAGDLTNNTVASYNFIVPNLCDDGHDCPLSQADLWLSQQLPMILASAAYSNNGAVFICWDEGNNNSDGPIGMIILSPLARGGGYHNNIRYDHGCTLRTFQEIFNVGPFLGSAGTAIDLSDLFGSPEVISGLGFPNGNFQFTVNGLLPGNSYQILCSTDLVTWLPVATNVCLGSSIVYSDKSSSSIPHRYYRVRRLQ